MTKKAGIRATIGFVGASIIATAINTGTVSAGTLEMEHLERTQPKACKDLTTDKSIDTCLHHSFKLTNEYINAMNRGLTTLGMNSLTAMTSPDLTESGRQKLRILLGTLYPYTLEMEETCVKKLRTNLDFTGQSKTTAAISIGQRLASCLDHINTGIDRYDNIASFSDYFKLSQDGVLKTYGYAKSMADLEPTNKAQELKL